MHRSPSPKFTHRKTTSADIIIMQASFHRRNQSSTNPGTPEDIKVAKNSTRPLSVSFNQDKNKSKSFKKLLDAASAYFSQQKPIMVHNYHTVDTYKPLIKHLEKDKEDLKIVKTKLQLELAQAKAKIKVYKNKIKSLKNYCKIMEVNSFTQFSRTFLKETEEKKDPEKILFRRKTMQPISNRSSETEIDFSN
ncbi:hypothetical protein SteCoe_37399 [Stentor coeruleus]|uniref:Uncharacterized protein n=1 Tax=Stentor coeruleus TaxID=5963 RepID=A0A1R2AN30_9CILI|nr:hypothetical protein SteCoe_37399 [Stentor coeruleus]